MSRSALLAMTVALLCTATTRSQVPAPGQQPTFRSGTDLVSVDVIVRVAGDAVGGLTASDFALRDNGVLQRIESTEATAVPVDVSLVVDVSGGDPVWSGNPRSPADIADRLRGIVLKTTAVLRPQDRVRLLTIDTYATEVLPMESRTAPAKVERVATAGLSSLYDALAAALLRVSEPSRRHLVIALTKAEDTISTIDGQNLTDLARRSDSVLHVVEGDSLIGNTQCDLAGASDLCTFPKRRFWRPARRQDHGLLATVAPLTGGAYHGTNLAGLNRDFVGTLENILGEFRHGYILRYTPQNVAREGWHDITVTVPARPGYAIQARRGYSIETSPATTARPLAAPAPARSAASTATAATVESLAEMFERGGAAAMRERLRQITDIAKLLEAARESDVLWPANPRREAVFMLELAAAGLRRNDAAREEAAKLLQQYDAFVRHPFGADRFECTWYWGELAALEGAIRPALTAPFVARALLRCPDEPRLVLAHAVITDQQWPLGTTAPWPGQVELMRPTDAQINEVTRRYAAAEKFPDTLVEARVRAAWFSYRIGKSDDALRLLDGMEGAATDRQIVYLRQLVRGHALRALGRFDEAVAAYRGGLTLWPGAQSSRVALMTLLLSRDEREQTESMAEDIQAAPDDQFDPWWMYWQGDYRAYPAIVARLLELAQ